jgi:hypothetical protein
MTDETHGRRESPKAVEAQPAAKEAQVVLRVPAALKNKWVRASQSEGRKLTEWLVARIEGAGQQSKTE